MPVADRQFESASDGTSAWMTESFGGIVAIVLTILGLARIAPAFLVAIARRSTELDKTPLSVA